jgi:YVTN family beta-propeller protein
MAAPACGTTPTPSVALNDADVTQPSSSSTIAVTDDAAVVVANELSGTVAAFDPATEAVLWETSVGADPVALWTDPWSGLIWTATADPELVGISSDGAISHRAALTARPAGIVGNRLHLFVSLPDLGVIEVLDHSSLESVATIATQANPRAMSIAPDDALLYIGHSPGARISVIDTDVLSVVDEATLPLEASVLRSMTLDPTGTTLAIPHQRSRTSNPRLTVESTVIAVTALVDVDALDAPRSLQLHSVDRPVNLPAAAVFTRGGDVLFVVNSGSNDVSVIDLDAPAGIAHIEVGDNPVGAAMSEDGRVAFVHNRLSSDVSIIGVDTMEEIGRVGVTTIPWPAEVLAGARLFFSADSESLTRDQWISCGSCHVDGGVDGLTWPFAQGDRNTPPIAGLSRTAPFHWDGERSDLLDFQSTIVGVQFGTGLSIEELEDLAAFLGSREFAPSPHPPDDESRRGAPLFDEACGSCHSGPDLTDRAVHDVGTGGSLDTPALVGLYATAPYLHDGSAPTLEAAIRRHTTEPPLADHDLAAITAYLLTLPAG